MIALERDSILPVKLEKASVSETQNLIDAYEAAEEISPKNTIYAHDSVKNALCIQQQKKCAFCETLLAQQFGNVEHFRPKKAWQTDLGSEVLKPGYFWLSYEWSNLLFSCEVCNIRFKRNYFPIKNESHRANPDVRDISVEEPLLIDPYSTEPSQHLRFIDWDIVAKDGSQMGEKSILGYGLDSNDLKEARRDRLSEVELVLSLVEKLVATNAEPEKVKKGVRYLQNSISQSGAYSAMIKDNLSDRIYTVIEKFENC